ncbi:MAG TPA: paraquat-inducible protein A [Gemmatimonadaceae bacterium]
MTSRNKLAVALALISLALLVPGLTKAVLTIKVTMNFLGKITELSNQTRSVIGTIRTLHEGGNNFVAGLILLFSIIVPLTKAALMIPVLAARDPERRRKVYLFVRSISKWAMADVFAVGILIAFLAAKATANLDAIAGPGFYFFVSYCLVSNASFQALEPE